MNLFQLNIKYELTSYTIWERGETTTYHGQAKSLKTLTLICLAEFTGVDIVKESVALAQIARIKANGDTKLTGEKSMTRGGLHFHLCCSWG